MKYFAFILVFFIGFLLTTPCGDRISANPIEQNTTENTKHQGEKEKHSDSCSPFCTCSCCGVQTIAAEYHTFSTKEIYISISKQIISYNPSVDLGAIKGIWQPPKI